MALILALKVPTKYAKQRVPDTIKQRTLHRRDITKPRYQRKEGTIKQKPKQKKDIVKPKQQRKKAMSVQRSRSTKLSMPKVLAPSKIFMARISIITA